MIILFFPLNLFYFFPFFSDFIPYIETKFIDMFKLLYTINCAKIYVISIFYFFNSMDLIPNCLNCLNVIVLKNDKKIIFWENNSKRK